jgi:PAS domain S-box-containing protein
MLNVGRSALDDAGDRLLNVLDGTPMELRRFLRLAVGIAGALAELHHRHIIHKHIAPQYIFIDPKTAAVILEDPSKPSPREAVPHTRDALANPDTALAYLSPEQLGRINRMMDCRSDLYSLGITLYEMLTGRLPFKAKDLLEWVHCHFARVPEAPRRLVPSTPPVVSDIIMKLLAKPVEDRYQSALGLKLDLERCLTQYENEKVIGVFPLGAGDKSDQLLIPEKLYGREKDIDLLFDAFERVLNRGAPEMIMIAGYSGIGKTSLVRELYRPIVREHGFFIAGKFDQYKHDIPYSTIIDAFQALIRQILTEPEARLKAWKQRLQNALGINGRIIVDILPQVAFIIGDQPPVPELPATETEYRFHMVLRQFIGVFSRREHPLVIFLDDLQWADAASLKLIEHIITEYDTGHLLLIGAYRENEVTAAHPLMRAIENIRKNPAVFQSITLSALSFTDLGRLLADTFHSQRAEVEPLTRLIYEKTAGNPFFVIQFLITLQSEHLVAFSGDEHRWKWDMNLIRAKGYTDNVVDLMTAKLRRLPAKTREALKLAACIGNQFDLPGLAAICDTSDEKTLEYLQEAVKETLLLCTAQNHYTFLHDRIQQAAYCLIAEEQRMALHLQIGRHMLAQATAATLAEKVFDIVNQFNLGAAMICDFNEKRQVAELGLMAGRKAKASTAYAAALNYLSQGAALLDDAAWESRYDLTFNLYKELAEVHYLNSNYAQSKELIDLLLGKAKSDLECAELYNILIIQYTLMAQYAQAIEFGRKALRLLNVSIPENNLEAELRAEMAGYRTILGNRKISSLIDEPEMSDPRKKVCLAILSNLLVTARYTDSSLFALIAVISVNLSLKYGPTAKSTVGYTAFGMVLQTVMGNYKDAYAFGELALKISEKFNDLAQKCQACLVLGHYLNHWVKHLRCADDILSDGFLGGLASGEMQWTGYTLAYKLFQPYYRGAALGQIQKEIPALLAFTRKTENQWATDTLLGLELALSRLAGDGSISIESKDIHDDAHEKKYLARCEAHRSFGALGRYAVLKAQILYLSGYMGEALQAATKARKLVGFFSSSISVAELNFYSSLIFAALYGDARGQARRDYLNSIRSNQATMKIWVDHCAENFKHQYLLVQAEHARINGKVLDAEYLYEQAIQSARENGFVQDQGIGNELASRFYMQRGLDTIAQAYLREAHSCYLRWGANVKARQLDQRHPGSVHDQAATAAGDLDIQAGHLDAIAIVKASQAISGEIVFSKLLQTLMHTVIENAGAQKGCLILAHGDDLEIEASASIDGPAVKIVRPGPSRLGAALPVTVLTYVKRTGETVLLDDATRRTMFSSDPYIQKNRPLSVLCLPLLRQSEMIGLLYLENSLVKDAFTKERTAVLELLASQAAISLENAALYQERSRAEQALRESEEKYRAIFEDSGTPMLFIEEDKTISICNKAFEKLSGYSRSELEGRKKWTEIVAQDTELAQMEEYHRLRRIDPLAAPQSYEFSFIDREGRLKDVVITVAMMPGTNQSLAAFLDITERNKALEDLHRSESKFRAIFDRSFQFMGLLTPDGIVLEANRTALEFAGMDESSVIGKPFWDTLWWRHSPEQQAKLQAAVRTAARGELVRFEASHAAVDGSPHAIDFSLKPVTDEAGNVVLLIPEGRDITERKRAEEERARLVTAIEQSAEAVCITDTRFIIRYANPALIRMSGYVRNEIIGQHVRILGSDRHDETFYAGITEALTRGEVWTGRLFYEKKDGGVYEAESTASPVRDRSGHIINFVSIHRDITREVQLERELRQVHKMEAIGTLAGGIAHDFNNILAVIQGHAELIHLKLSPSSALQGSLEQVLLSCSRAKDLVMQILTFTRQTEHEMKPLQIFPLVEEGLKLLRSTLPTTIDIRRDMAAGVEHSVILADATQIHQVLMNLATNAAHAMGARGGVLSVGLLQERIDPASIVDFPGLAAGNYVRLTVSDTGHGMDASVMERIFDPYFTTKKLGEGTGMGLAVTQGIVKAYQGAIHVRSEPGLGTTFHVFFPEFEGEVSSETQKIEPLHSGNEHILLVDDEAALVDLGQEMLKVLGYRVTARTNSLQALETFRRQPDAFDLVITDMTMPGLTGTELARQLIAIRPGLPVILCTGFSEHAGSKQSMAPGIREFLMKPYLINEMAAAIRRALKPVGP